MSTEPEPELTIERAARDFVKDANKSARFVAAVEREVAAAVKAIHEKIAREVQAKRKP